jgi:esterase
MTADAMDPDSPTHIYDEFSMLADNCAEVGLRLPDGVPVSRVSHTLAAGSASEGAGAAARFVSALRWGTGPVELVFVHGAAQNAHTWDTTALALHTRGIRDMLCIDLPGHGRSAWRADHRYDPLGMAEDLASIMEAVAPSARAVVGMSLGGMTTLALADAHPRLVAKLAMVDVTPGVNALKAKAVTDFVRGPQSFDTFGSLLKRTMEHNPTRSESSLRRGILHNAHRNADGSWSWNYDRGLSEAMPANADPGAIAAVHATTPDPAPAAATGDGAVERFSSMWEIYGRLAIPLLVLRGSLSPIVDDNDIAEVRRRKADTQVIVVENAGHSIQGDQPVVLAGHIADFVAP